MFPIPLQDFQNHPLHRRHNPFIPESALRDRLTCLRVRCDQMRADGEEARLKVSSFAVDLGYELSKQRDAIREKIVPLYNVGDDKKRRGRHDESAERVGGESSNDSVEVAVGDRRVRVRYDEGTACLGDVVYVILGNENGFLLKVCDRYVSAVHETLDNMRDPSACLFVRI